MKRQVLILGNAQDFHSQLVYESVSARGAEVNYLDLSEFPSALRLSIQPERDSGHLSLPNGKFLGFHEIDSIYWRNFNQARVPTLPNDDQTHVARNDSRSLIESLVSMVPCRWVNDYEGFLLHQRKPAALARVAKLGVRIPKTLIGNDPDAIRHFISETPQCIFKPVQGGAHTQRLTNDHLSEENLASLKIAPITIQEEIAGTNIRVFIAGEKVFCCEVATSAIDFRDDKSPRIHPFPISPELETLCLQIGVELSLVWSGIDFRVTPQGEWVFLEANPSPMFHGFQSETKFPLLESLTDLLLA